MRIPDAVIQAILDKLDVVGFVGNYVSLQKKGSRWFGLSPFKAEKTPSFTVDPDKGLYYDFSTAKGGSVFNLVMELDGLTFPEAVRRVAAAAGVTVPESDAPVDNRRSALLDLYRRVAGSFHFMLAERPYAAAAREYLEKRGITRETVDAFQLGYAPPDGTWLWSFLRQKGYSEEFLKESGLFAGKDKRWCLFVDRVMFPILSARGEVLAFGGRRMSERGPKYINSPETDAYKKSANLYGLNAAMPTIRKNKDFVLVEGYTDVIALHQAGVTQAVAPLGTAFTDGQAGLLARAAGRCRLFYDGDEAGFRATIRSASICEEHGIETAVIPVEGGQDPADLLEKEGPSRLKTVAESGINTLEYLLQKIVPTATVSDPRSASFVLQQLFPYIRSMASEVRREQGLVQLADSLGVDVEAVRQDYKQGFGAAPARPKSPSNGAGDAVSPKSVRTRRSVSHDLYLMLAVASHRELYSFVRAAIATDDLEDEAAVELFIALEDAYRHNETSTEALLERIDNSSLRDLTIHRISSGEFDANSEQVVRDSVHRVKMRSLETKRSRIEARLRHLSRTGASGPDGRQDDPEELRRLLEDKIYLDGELLRLKEEQHD